MTQPLNENPTAFAMRLRDLKASGNIGDSFLFPGAVTNSDPQFLTLKGYQQKVGQAWTITLVNLI